MKPVSTTTNVLRALICLSRRSIAKANAVAKVVVIFAAIGFFAATQNSFANSAEGVPAPAPSPGIGPFLDPTLPIFPPPPPISPPLGLDPTVDFSWNKDSNTAPNNEWSVSADWTPTAPVGGPSGAGIYVLIGDNITTGGGRTINLFDTGNNGAATKTVGRIDIGDTDTSSPFTIAAGSGSGVLNFDGNGDHAQLNELSTSKGDTISAPVTLNSSLDITNASSNTLNISGTISSATAGAKTITTSTGAVTLGGIISDGSGSVAIAQNGPGTVALGTSANTYSGGTTISGGKITIGGSGTPLGSGALTLSGGTLVETASRSTAITGNVVVTADSAITTSSNSAVTLPFSGTLTGTGGTLTLRNDGPATTAQFDVRFSGGDYTMSQPIVIDNGAGGGTTRLSDFNVSGTTHTYNGVISGNGSYNRSSSTTGGTTIFNANNTYTGSTTVNIGTLQLNNTNSASSGRISGTSNVTVNAGGTLVFNGSSSWTDRINDSATMTLAAGRFNTGGLSEHGATNNTAGIGALTLTGGGIIDLGAGASIIAFANSSAATWTGTLSIYNWTGNTAGGGTDQVYFGNDNTGLTNTQLGEVNFFSDSGVTSLGAAMILVDGEIVPVPEPATWFAGSLAIIGVGGIWLQRARRRRAVATA